MNSKKTKILVAGNEMRSNIDVQIKNTKFGYYIVENISTDQFCET